MREQIEEFNRTVEQDHFRIRRWAGEGRRVRIEVREEGFALT